MGSKRTEKLSDQLRRLIEASPLSRYEISKRTGIDQAVLCKFVAGQRGISTGSWDKLAECLGLRLVGDDQPGKEKGK